MGAANTGPAGDTYPAQRLAILNSNGAAVATKQITSAYPQVEDFRQEKVAQVRQFAFQGSDSDPNTFYINGTRFDPGKVNSTVKLGDLEEWQLDNPSQELHQFHIHQTDFQVVEINGNPVRFSGYRDNVYIPATGWTTLRIPFRDPVMLGKFFYHCHLLDQFGRGLKEEEIIQRVSAHLSP